MKLFKTTLLLCVTFLLFNCASGYKTINPNTLNYFSTSKDTSGVLLNYKYELLDKKYKKKELKKGIRLVAVRIINNSDRDLKFGKDFVLTYDNGSLINIIENESVFQSLKQSVPSYLWYLLLTPLKFMTTKSTNGVPEETSSTPIGLVIGPGIAGGNMIAAGSANEKFKKDLLDYNINGTIIKKGETVSGLLGISSYRYDALKIKMIQ